MAYNYLLAGVPTPTSCTMGGAFTGVQLQFVSSKTLSQIELSNSIYIIPKLYPSLLNSEEELEAVQYQHKTKNRHTQLHGSGIAVSYQSSQKWLLVSYKCVTYCSRYCSISFCTSRAAALALSAKSWPEEA